MATEKLARAAVGNFPEASALRAGRAGLGQGQRQLVQPGVVTDHQHVAVGFAQALQAQGQPVAVSEIELVLDQTARPRGEPGHRQLQRLAGARRA